MSKIIITGTGRCGTSFLMQLMSHLDMNTGYSNSEQYEDHPPYNIRGINAGFENIPLNIESVRIHKAPAFAVRIPQEDIIAYYDIKHVIIPIRDLVGASKSRIKAGMPTLLPLTKDDAIVENANIDQIMNYNGKTIYNLIYTLAVKEIPYTFLPFPEMFYDAEIIYNKLKWLFDEYGVTKDNYLTIYTKLVDTDKISFKK